jgi:8-oxo-dGTP pyrophosphatase MutT (NUDIX family)
MSLPNDARDVLTRWTATDSDQAALRDEYVTHIDSFDDAMYRSCVPGHLTASTLILNESREQVLLTLHPKVGLWLQMGGHCEEADETLLSAAAREAREESGIADLLMSEMPLRLDRHKVGCHGGSWHLDVQYLAIAPATAQVVMSDESLDLAWFPVDTPPDLTDNALRELVATALR